MSQKLVYFEVFFPNSYFYLFARNFFAQIPNVWQIDGKNL